MKRPGDMKRRREAAYRRGCRDTLECVLGEIERLAEEGQITEAGLRELRDVCGRPPPDEAEVSQRRVS